MRPRLEPFGLAKGRLQLEGVDLGEIAGGLDGKAAWLVSAAAVLAEVGSRPRTVAVSAIGPLAVLALLAQRGCWAAAASPHELLLAQQAGFPPERIVAHAPLLDDGFLIEALSAGVAVLVRSGREGNAGVRRIARALGLRQPSARGAPPALPASAFGRCGGLLARLLSAGPTLALDAAAGLRTASLVVVVPGASGAGLSVAGAARLRPVALRELSGRPARAARLLGRPQRGDWVAVRANDALAPRAPHPAWPEPRTVLVGGGLWRLLDARPLPAPD